MTILEMIKMSTLLNFPCDYGARSIYKLKNMQLEHIEKHFSNTINAILNAIFKSVEAFFKSDGDGTHHYGDSLRNWFDCFTSQISLLFFYRGVLVNYAFKIQWVFSLFFT